MDFVNKFTGGDANKDNQKPVEEKKEGGFMGGLTDKFNSAAGGGKESEKNEDYLDKGMYLSYLYFYPRADASISSHLWSWQQISERKTEEDNHQNIANTNKQESTSSKSVCSVKASKTTSLLSSKQRMSKSPTSFVDSTRTQQERTFQSRTRSTQRFFEVNMELYYDGFTGYDTI